MEYSYENLLKETFITEDNHKGSFIKEGDQVYIVSEDSEKIPFDFFYKDELYDFIIIAACQLLDATIEEIS